MSIQARFSYGDKTFFSLVPIMLCRVPWFLLGLSRRIYMIMPPFIWIKVDFFGKGYREGPLPGIGARI